ncbi:nicotinate-nucleotide--dimethylbenzimidazole phosphoribosyltransferase [Glycomyces buryatensis]|uniref:Nicotinate-nucleotide--dimethylbenzimidazole phosphoribosyltransferase n=1 Tax=Glycomyces buryatensis TaxID=2570927 RepID=A0A4S8QG47_9ACTN|nr:nicotinate-nucleotide--dimethylbenzimidazole phosphoribosyltransferase [Glycomyces buryatensis]THV42681.1 nicotinate-nucleotide--dimethylbenzimidazole phosphoribosyltransferase [Glycomyces buryatensis]
MTETTGAGPLDDLKAKFPNGVWTTRANARLQDALIEGSGLGGLQPAVGWAARMQSTDSPEPFASPQMLLFAGEYPDGWASGERESVTEQADALERGEGRLAEQAARAGLPVTVVRTAASGGSEGPLLDDDQLQAALTLGRETADRAIDGGADILLIAGLGAGASTASVGVCSFIAKEDITSYMPQLRAPGGIVDDRSWMGRVAALRDHLAFNRGFKRKADALASRLGGAEIATMAATIFTAAVRSTPVLLDGPAALAAMMIARDFGLAAPKWCYAPNRAPHPVITKLAKQGGLADDLGLGLDLGETSALILGWDMVQQSLRLASALPFPPKEEEDEDEDEKAEAETATEASTESDDQPDDEAGESPETAEDRTESA